MLDRLIPSDGQWGPMAAHIIGDGRTRGSNNPSRAITHPLDKPLYRERHLIECCIGKLKQFRRVATRYEKTARNYRAVVAIAATVIWLR